MPRVRKGYLFQRGAVFYACWFVGEKKYVKTTGQTNRRDATKELARIMEPFLIQDEIKTLQNVKTRIEGARAELASLDEKSDPPLSLAAAWETFEKSPDRPDSGEATLRQYLSEMRRFQKWIGDHRGEVELVRDVTADIANAYAQDLSAKGASASTYNQHINLLALMWRTVGKKAKTEANPWEAIRRKHLVSVSRRELTVEELTRVINSAEGEMQLLFMLGAYTGMRLGDCATLKWGEVDLVRNLIRRVPMKVARRNNKPVLVPLFPLLRASIAQIPPASRLDDVLPATAEQYRRDGSALSKRIQAHFMANGIATQNKSNGKMKATVSVGFHSLRHTLVSLLRSKDAPLSVVEALVGHSNPAMTRHYTHTSEAAANQAISMLPSIVMGNDANIEAQTIDPRAALAEVVEIARTLTGENWEEVRADILAVAEAAEWPANPKGISSEEG